VRSSAIAFFEQIVDHAGPLPQSRRLTVIAQDPSITVDGQIVTAELSVPAEVLEPGPRGARLHVVDYDAATGLLELPVVIGDNDPFANAPLDSTAHTFRAQNVYAIAARTLATFEEGLGRRVPWSFNGHQLFLIPRAFPELNAYYSPEDGAIFFGYLPLDGGMEMQTCLSHDVIAHETTHAVLDGLRPRLAEPGLPDQPAFHEALADIVALLSVFSLEEVVARLLGKPDAQGRLKPSALTPEALRQTALFALAEELGTETGGERGSGLRRSIDLARSDAWKVDPAYREAHRRGEVLVAAVMSTLLKMWTGRLTALISPRGADAARVVEEGAKSADHLLHMFVRGIDYMPPIELEFKDVIDSVIKADEIVAPDDPHHYRDSLTEAFGAFGIVADPERIINLSHDEQPQYERMNYALLRSHPDEVFRFIWENAQVFGIDRRYRIRVDAVRPSMRVGPNGLVVPEVVADYVQSLELTAAELARKGVVLPPRLKPDTPLQVWGGGVLVFDQFGRAKLHQAKRLDDWQRQSERINYLAEQGLFDTKNRLGFTLSIPRGQRFAAMHVADSHAGEDW